MIVKLFFTDSLLTIFNVLLFAITLSAAEAYGGIFEMLSVVLFIFIILGVLVLVILGIICIWKED